MLEQIVIGLLFLAALTYLGRRAYRSLFVKKSGCEKGCGCDGADTLSRPQKKASVH